MNEHKTQYTRYSGMGLSHMETLKADILNADIFTNLAEKTETGYYEGTITHRPVIRY